MWFEKLLQLFWVKKLQNITNFDQLNYRATSSVASPPHWHVDENAEWEKHYVFSTFKTVLCTGVD